MFLGWNWSSTVFSHIAPILGSIFGTVWADTVFEFRGEEVLILLGGLSVRLHLVGRMSKKLTWFDLVVEETIRWKNWFLSGDGSSGGGEFYIAFYGPDNRTTFLVRLEFLSSWGLYLDIFGVLGERQSLLFVNNIWLSFLPHTADILLLLFCFFPIHLYSSSCIILLTLHHLIDAG